MTTPRNKQLGSRSANRSKKRRNLKGIFGLLAVSVVTLGLAFALLGPPILAKGLKYEVFADDLEDVSALAFDRNGDLYATLEKTRGRGRVVHIRQGLIRTVLDGLDKPDGMLLRGDTLYITGETGDHGLIVYESGKVRYVDHLSGTEGIASAGEEKILVVEDRKQDGRLLRVNPSTGEVEILLEGLKQPESVCQSPEGRIYFVEKALHNLSVYADGQHTAAVTGLESPAFLNCLADGSILITEDRTNFGRLLRYREGGIEVLARNLRAPQTVAIGADGAFYVSEQRKNRILKIYEP